MATYQVECFRKAYVTVTVSASNAKEAKSLAIEKAHETAGLYYYYFGDFEIGCKPQKNISIQYWR